jgi:hypothetical protein
MSQLDVARYLGATPEIVAAWEARGAISPLHRARLAMLLAPHLALPEGEAFTRAFERGAE